MKIDHMWVGYSTEAFCVKSGCMTSEMLTMKDILRVAYNSANKIETSLTRKKAGRFYRALGPNNFS